jgi:hypothetical protein
LNEVEHDPGLFHRSNTKKVFADRRGTVVDELAEARDHMNRVMQSFTTNSIGVEEVVVILRVMVEGTGRPLYIYAHRSDRPVDSSAMAY